MMLEITDSQARDMAWCLLASIDAALKLGLGEMAEERMTLLRKIAPAQAEMQGVPEPAIPTSWLDAAQWQDMVHAVENMLRFLHTQPNQRERLATYERLLKIITTSAAMRGDGRKESAP